MTIVDASALVKVLAEKGSSGDALRKRLRGEALAAPAHIDAEVLSVIRGLTLSGKLDIRRAEKSLGLLEVMPLTRAPLTVHLGRSWQLRSNYSVYDALYLALAESLACPLVTGDARIANGVGARCEIEVFS